MGSIFHRELKNYFVTPIGYVFMGMFLLVSGVFFSLINLRFGTSDLAEMFSMMNYLFMLIVPLLTMRLLSEERKSKTDRLLLTAPITIWSFVLGKFLAACMVLLLSLVGSIFFVVIIAAYGTIYPGLILSNYLGFFLMGMCYIAIGVLMSALTESQLTAAVLTFGVNLLLQIAEGAAPTINVPMMPFLPNLFAWLSLYARHSEFTAGIISIANILYDLSFAFMLLFLTVRVIDRRRWEG